MKTYLAIPMILSTTDKTIRFDAVNMKKAIEKVEAMDLSYAVFIVSIHELSKNIVWAMGASTTLQK